MQPAAVASAILATGRQGLIRSQKAGTIQTYVCMKPPNSGQGKPKKLKTSRGNRRVMARGTVRGTVPTEG